MDNLNDRIEQLKNANLALRQRLERAELLLPQINQQIEQLAGLHLFDDLVILGNVLFQRPYLPGTCWSDSAQLCQAVLLLPGGIGVVLWDTEEYLHQRNIPDGLEAEALLRFVPFQECGAGIKAMLVSEAQLLLDQLIRQIMPKLGT